jgi:hypothetical protein
MACFIVPTIVGIAVHANRKKIPAHWHPEWLVAMILGGAAGLSIEHIAHGEIVPWPPFLTAMATPESAITALNEMALVGIPMTAALVLIWAGLVYAYNKRIIAKESQAAAIG